MQLEGVKRTGPLLAQNARQLGSIPGVRVTITPLRRLVGNPLRVHGDQLAAGGICQFRLPAMVKTAAPGEGGRGGSLVLDLGQEKPGKVPRPAAAGVVEHPRLGILKQLVAEWILSCEAAELVQEVVRAHTVAPRVRHLVDELCGEAGERREDTLDPLELSEAVHVPAPQRLTHLVDLRDGAHLVGVHVVGDVEAGVARHFGGCSMKVSLK